MSAPGLFRPPPPRNEPVKDYAPGSPERASLRLRLEQMRNERLDIPLVIGGVTQFPAKTPSYWLVNADARLSLADYGLEKTYLQFNVYNLFDKLYYGGLDGSLTQSTSAPFVQIGAPRTVSGTLVIGF